MNIELPKDAEGREIPLDTKVLYDYDGSKQNVEVFIFSRKDAEWSIETNLAIYDAEELYLTPPDSWEKLEEDLGRAAERKDITSQCRYFNNTNRCAKCPISKVGGCTHKDELAFRDILDRIRKLRGED